MVLAINSLEAQLWPELASAVLHAAAGDDGALAGVIPPELLGCRDADSIAGYLRSLPRGGESRDYLIAGVVASWSLDTQGTYQLFATAQERATEERSYEVAVAARERTAHHARIFGDADRARHALEDAMRLAEDHGSTEGLVRTTAAAARLALDSGDSERAALLLARGQAEAADPEMQALLAPAGAALAAESGDETMLARWGGEAIARVALRSTSLESSVAATIALLTANGAGPGSAAAVAMRRALLRGRGATCAIELYSLAARYGDLDEARLAADSLSAFPAPGRKYLKAHALFARAHLLFRCGERAAWIDHAGDAARAFNSMGLRRWMNEAMLLLVRQENDNFPRRRRGRPVGSGLTGREQQVAHLIRRGARNREVAAALQISEHTVERHVSSILGRLGLRSRWQIVDPKNVAEH